jgi:hypothetical protein
LKEKPTFNIHHGWIKMTMNEENLWETKKQKVLPDGI